MADEKRPSLIGVRRQPPPSPISQDGVDLQLVELVYQTWLESDSESRIKYLQDLNERYQGFLDEFYSCANQCVESYLQYSNRHTAWRRRIIIGTGLVAIVNLLAAYKGFPTWVGEWMPLLAAVCAVSLGILANLESFYACSERANAYRESRDLFLDAARESNRLWDAYVRPLGESATACVNASELYRKIVSKDQELRVKIKELTKAEKNAPTSKP